MHPISLAVRRCAAAATILICVSSSPLRAQTAPSAGEIAAYAGLFRAVADGKPDAVRSAIRAPHALHATDGNGRTPLHVATFLKRREVIPMLIKAGAKTGALDNQKYDAVTIAAVADDPATLKILLDNGASAKLVTSVYDGTALIAAAHLGHDTSVQLLIRAGAPLDHVNNLGWTALIESIVLGNGGKRHQATLKRLLDAKASPNIADRQGASPLAHARARGFAEMVRMLEATGAR